MSKVACTVVDLVPHEGVIDVTAQVTAKKEHVVRFQVPSVVFLWGRGQTFLCVTESALCTPSGNNKAECVFLGVVLHHDDVDLIISNGGLAMRIPARLCDDEATFAQGDLVRTYLIPDHVSRKRASIHATAASQRPRRR